MRDFHEVRTLHSSVRGGFCSSAETLYHGATVKARQLLRRRESNLSDFLALLGLPTLHQLRRSFSMMLRRSRISDAAVVSLQCRFSLHVGLARCRFQRAVNYCTASARHSLEANFIMRFSTKLSESALAVAKNERTPTAARITSRRRHERAKFI